MQILTYPPVTDRERDDALARIRGRHQKHDDPRWSEAEADSDEAAYSVLAYLQRRHGKLPRRLAADNLADELVLSAWIHWDQRGRERELLHRARYYGYSLADLAAFLGIGTRQGMRDYLDRADALLEEYDRITARPLHPATGDGATSALTRLPRSSRAARGADVHAARTKRAAARVKPTRDEWTTTHQPRITGALTRLLTQAARCDLHPDPTEDTDPEVDEDTDTEPDSDTEDLSHNEIGLGDYLAWLSEDLERDHVTTGTLGALGLALGELRTHPAVTAQEANHGIHHAIRTADRLRAEFASLTPDNSSTSPVSS